MNCEFCGAAIPPGAGNCPACGATVTASSAQAAPAAAPQPAPAFQPGAAVPGTPEPKSRLAYILLGVFLGTLGIHNFYAGRTTPGIIQLLLTLVGGPLTCGATCVAAWIWAIVEICTVKADGKGLPFKD